MCENGICREPYPACTTRLERKVCNETLNSYGPGLCKNSLDCRERRYCTAQGKCDNWMGVNPPCSDHNGNDCDEKMNIKGPGKCFSNNDCSVGRYCTEKGVCDDKPKPI